MITTTPNRDHGRRLPDSEMRRLVAAFRDRYPHLCGSDDDGDICPTCNGSGEGRADGTYCTDCNRTGDANERRRREDDEARAEFYRDRYADD